MTARLTLTGRTSAAAILALLLLGGAPSAAAADRPPAGDSAAHATLAAERQRVRAELDRVNAEIDGLKRGERGMRDDYRLRARLADAEALARRLTEIDARLGATGAAATPQPSPLAAEPRLTAADGPAEMDAKADILIDQARRLGAQAETLHQRAQQLKARQDLRRRIGQMEHDPFSPLEGSKRRVAAGAPVPSRSGTTETFGATPPGGATSIGTAGGQDKAAGPAVPAAGAGSSPGGRGLVAPAAAPTPTAGTFSTDGASLSMQLRDLLDPATLAEIRKLETSGAPGAGVEALERAVAALRARADRLQGQAQAFRARAHQPR